MKIFTDYEGRAIRLTDERLQHIVEHPEMHGMEDRIEETLRNPQKVLESLSDPEARLYYRLYLGTRVGDKHPCVVVKVAENDAMAEKRLRIWYDKEGDFLEVIFEQRAGYFRQTANPHVMEKVDDEGNVLGFSVMRVSALRDAPLEVAL